MSIEEAFKNKVSPDKPEKQTSRDEKENAAELHKNKESEGVPQSHAEEYTELPLHALAHDSMFTAIPTGRAYLHLVESTACLRVFLYISCCHLMKCVYFLSVCFHLIGCSQNEQRQVSDRTF